jgi:hypothetical protein
MRSTRINPRSMPARGAGAANGPLARGVGSRPVTGGLVEPARIVWDRGVGSCRGRTRAASRRGAQPGAETPVRAACARLLRQASVPGTGAHAHDTRAHSHLRRRAPRSAGGSGHGEDEIEHGALAAVRRAGERHEERLFEVRVARKAALRGRDVLARGWPFHARRDLADRRLERSAPTSRLRRRGRPSTPVVEARLTSPAPGSDIPENVRDIVRSNG